MNNINNNEIANVNTMLTPLTENNKDTEKDATTQNNKDTEKDATTQNNSENTGENLKVVETSTDKSFEKNSKSGRDENADIIDIDCFTRQKDNNTNVLKQLRKLQGCFLEGLNSDKLNNKNQLLKYVVLCAQTVKNVLQNGYYNSNNIYDLSTYSLKQNLTEIFNCVSDGYYFCIKKNNNDCEITNVQGFLQTVLKNSLVAKISDIRLGDKQKNIVRNLNSFFSILQNSNYVNGENKDNNIKKLVNLQLQISDAILNTDKPINFNNELETFLADLFINCPKEFSEFISVSKLFDLEQLLPLESFVKTALINIIENKNNVGSNRYDTLKNQKIKLSIPFSEKTNFENEATYLNTAQQDLNILSKTGVLKYEKEKNVKIANLIQQKLESLYVGEKSNNNNEKITQTSIRLALLCEKLFVCLLRPEEEFNNVYNLKICETVKKLIDQKLPGYTDKKNSDQIFSVLNESNFVTNNYSEKEIQRFINGIENYYASKYKKNVSKDRIKIRTDKIVPCIVLDNNNEKEQNNEIFVLLHNDYKIPFLLSKRMEKVTRTKNTTVYCVSKEEYTILKLFVANLERKNTLSKLNSLESIKAIGFNNTDKNHKTNTIKEIQDFVNKQTKGLNLFVAKQTKGLYEKQQKALKKIVDLPIAGLLQTKK